MNNNFLKKAKITGKLFAKGATDGATSGLAITVSVLIGAHQALKYGGNLGRGVSGGLTQLAAFAIIGGVLNVISNKDLIKQSRFEKMRA
jgi:hypothetical protein